jgi:hypothetical protein
MMRARRIAELGALGFFAVACTTITEEMPTRPNPVGGSNPVPLPVVVVPVPVPTPDNSVPLPAPNATPAPVATPAPTNPSNPSATPAPPENPAPTPTTPPGGIPPDIPDNASPVTKLGAKVYFVECGGEEVPGSGNATEAQVGCRVLLDVTPKDSSNKPTQVKGTPEWSFDNMSIISVSSTRGFNPTFIAKAPGVVTCHAEVDGVRSNDVSIHLHN